jgi:hypothetical protein
MLQLVTCTRFELVCLSRTTHSAPRSPELASLESQTRAGKCWRPLPARARPFRLAVRDATPEARAYLQFVIVYVSVNIPQNIRYTRNTRKIIS